MRADSRGIRIRKRCPTWLMASNLLKLSDLQFPFTRGANERQRHVPALSVDLIQTPFGDRTGWLRHRSDLSPPRGIEIIEDYGKVGEM